MLSKETLQVQNKDMRYFRLIHAPKKIKCEYDGRLNACTVSNVRPSYIVFVLLKKVGNVKSECQLIECLLHMYY